MRVLHAGCGGAPLPGVFEGADEVRLDIDAEHNPHVVASLTDMGDIGEFDIAYSSHCLEHLYPHDVEKALAEFYRVTKPGGMTMIVVPDLEGLTISDEVLYESTGGPITALDMIYGYRRLLKDRPYMAHHTGFIARTLEQALRDAGFQNVMTQRPGDYNLVGVGIKEPA